MSGIAIMMPLASQAHRLDEREIVDRMMSLTDSMGNQSATPQIHTFTL
jgi:hypothetical protein